MIRFLVVCIACSIMLVLLAIVGVRGCWVCRKIREKFVPVRGELSAGNSYFGFVCKVSVDVVATEVIF